MWLPKNYDYIARMDADDISLSGRFKKQIAYMETHPDVDCLGTWAIEIGNGGNEYFKKQMPVTNEECLEFFKIRDCMIHPTVMFRRSYFEKAGLYPENTYFGEDTMMWAKGFKAGCQFANLPEYLLKFRLDPNFFHTCIEKRPNKLTVRALQIIFEIKRVSFQSGTQAPRLPMRSIAETEPFPESIL